MLPVITFIKPFNSYGKDEAISKAKPIHKGMSNSKKSNNRIKDSSQVDYSEISEAEQQIVENIGCALDSDKVFKSSNQAISYLKVLIKGDYSKIRAYQNELKSNQRLEIALKGKIEQYTERVAEEWYEGDMQVAISKIETKSKDGVEAIAQVIEVKKKYPKAVATAIKKLRQINNSRLLYELSKHKSPAVRLEAAGKLLLMGDRKVALTVFEDLIQIESYSPAISGLLNGRGKALHEDCISVLDKAINNPKAEIRLIAAKALYDNQRINVATVENIAFSIISNLKNKTTIDYGIDGVSIDSVNANAITYTADRLGRFISDSKACDMSIKLLSKSTNIRYINVINIIKDNNTDWRYVCR